MISKTLHSLRKRGLRGFLNAVFVDLLEICERSLSYRRDYRSSYRFNNRSTNKSTLVIILAGYKPYLWPATLARMAKHAPNDADICIASAGMHSTRLEKLCASNGWSYLSVTRNAPGIALNKAIELHPAADYIYKLDEDIFIGRDFYRLLREGYEHAWHDTLLEPGFCAPVLNVNGISYRIFLKELELESNYQQEFGEILVRCGDLPVHSNPDASWWLWKNSLPFDEKVAQFSQRVNRYSICNTRFSIGAILLRREFIEKTGGFKSAWRPGVLGIDEDMLCRDCVSFSRPMIIIESVLAGHFSFYPQEALMKKNLPELSQLDSDTFPKTDYAAAQ